MNRVPLQFVLEDVRPVDMSEESRVANGVYVKSIEVKQYERM